MWPDRPAPVEQDQGQVQLYGSYPSHFRMSYPPEYTRQSPASLMGGLFSEVSWLSHMSIPSTSSIPMSSGQTSSLQGALDASRKMLPYPRAYQATEEETSSESSPESPPVYKTRGPKMHECEICQKKFPRPSGLRTHMNSHNKIKPFACEYHSCPRVFTVLSNARRHLRTHGVTPKTKATPPPYFVHFDTPTIIPSSRSTAQIESTFAPHLEWLPPTCS